MLKTVDIKVNVDRPNWPVETARVYVGSAATFRIHGVPAYADGVSVTGLAVSVENVDGEILSVPAKKIGETWTATFAESHFAHGGIVTGGVTIALYGIDESEERHVWKVAKVDIEIMTEDGTVTPGNTAVRLTDKTLDGETVDLTTMDGLAMGLTKVLRTMGATVVGMLAMCVMAAPSGDSYSEGGVTWSRVGALPRTAYVVTNVTMSGSVDVSDLTPLSNYVDSVVAPMNAEIANKRDVTNMTARVPGIPSFTSGGGWFTVDDETAAWNGYNYVTPSGMIILNDAGVFRLVYDPKDGYMDAFALAPPNYTARVVNINSGHSYTVRGYLPATLATSLDVDAITNDLNEVKVESSLIYRLYSGSNAVMEVTNYNSRVNPPSMRLQQLNDEGEYITIWTETNGLARIARAATNYTDSVTAADRAAAAAAYAPRAWSGVTSGLGAEAPAGTTWISTPSTVFAGGLEYEKVATSSGALWFLRSNGMQTSTNKFGYLSITATDGTEIFSIEKTDSYLVGVDADGIRVSGNTVTLSLGVVSAEHPLLRYTPSLSPVAWEKEEDGFTSPITAVWSGSSGAWVCTVTTSATQGFFAFEFMQEGSVKIKNAAALDASAGILCTDGKTRIRPVNNNGTITWEIF